MDIRRSSKNLFKNCTYRIGLGLDDLLRGALGDDVAAGITAFGANRWSSQLNLRTGIGLPYVPENAIFIAVSTVADIQKAIEQLPQKDQAALTAWLQSRDEPILSKQEEAALLASLDKAAGELDAGRGVPIETVRERVAKWATK
jgi:hypothetical protein